MIDTDGDGTTDNNTVLQFGNKMTFAVYVDDVLQDPSTAYTANDSTITFITAPATGAVILVKYNTEVITSSPDSDSRFAPNSQDFDSKCNCYQCRHCNRWYSLRLC